MTVGTALHVGPPPSGGRFVALALSRFCPLDGFELWHVGLLYREAEGAPLQLLEMLGDQHLRVEDAETGALDGYAWIPLPLGDDDAQRLSAMCRAVAVWLARNGRSIRLAFVYNGGEFDLNTGKHMPASGEYGLYCSTFVLAVCGGVGIELLKRSTWTATREMSDAVRWFAKALRDHRGEDIHPGRILRDHACVVFHPLEVMASALESPISHDRAKELAKELRAEYDALFSPVDW